MLMSIRGISQIELVPLFDTFFFSNLENKECASEEMEGSFPPTRSIELAFSSWGGCDVERLVVDFEFSVDVSGRIVLIMILGVCGNNGEFNGGLGNAK